MYYMDELNHKPGLMDLNHVLVLKQSMVAMSMFVTMAMAMTMTMVIMMMMMMAGVEEAVEAICSGSTNGATSQHRSGIVVFARLSCIPRSTFTD